jgi:hypothetical protein
MTGHDPLRGFRPAALARGPADDPTMSQAAAIASLQDEIGVLDRIIAWQLKTIDWHLEEDRRLRDQATRVRGP